MHLHRNESRKCVFYRLIIDLYQNCIGFPSIVMALGVIKYARTFQRIPGMTARCKEMWIKERTEMAFRY